MAVHGGCGGEMGGEGGIVTGRVPSIPVQSPPVLLAPEKTNSLLHCRNHIRMW